MQRDGIWLPSQQAQARWELEKTSAGAFVSEEPEVLLVGCSECSTTGSLLCRNISKTTLTAGRQNMQQQLKISSEEENSREGSSGRILFKGRLLKSAGKGVREEECTKKCAGSCCHTQQPPPRPLKVGGDE